MIINSSFILFLVLVVCELVLVLDGLHRVLSAGFLDESAHQDFVEQVVGFMKVENHVEFAHIAEILVQHFNQLLNDFQSVELVVLLIHDANEKQTCVPLIHNLTIAEIQKIAFFLVAREH